MAGNKNSGRKSKTVLTRQTEQVISETAPGAMAYLRDVANGDIPPLHIVITTKYSVTEKEVSGVDPTRVDVCKYVINQHIGSPRQRTDIDVTSKGESLVIREVEVRLNNAQG